MIAFGLTLLLAAGSTPPAPPLQLDLNSDPTTKALRVAVTDPHVDSGVPERPMMAFNVALLAEGRKLDGIRWLE